MKCEDCPIKIICGLKPDNRNGDDPCEYCKHETLETRDEPCCYCDEEDCRFEPKDGEMKCDNCPIKEKCAGMEDTGLSCMECKNYGDNNSFCVYCEKENCFFEPEDGEAVE